jgi:hypothetical protein
MSRKRRLAKYKVPCVRCGEQMFRDLNMWDEDQYCDDCLDREAEFLRLYRGGVSSVTHVPNVIVTPIGDAE